MPRKFQIDDVVVLSNPRSNENKRFINQTFTVSTYDGSSNPYRIVQNNGVALWVRASEISAATQTPSRPTVENEELTSSDPVRSLVEETPNERAMNSIMVLDEVLVMFKPTSDDIIEHLGIKRAMSVWGIRGDYKNSKIGKIGKVVKKGESSIRVNFGDAVSAWFPAACLAVVKKGGGLFSFKASQDETATIFPDHVLVDELNVKYSFDLFENLWTAIKKYKKTGYHERIDLQGEWTGIFHADSLEVGCQMFGYDNIRRLVALIRKVKKMTK